VRLVFRRASYDEPWVLDQAATFAGTPPPARARFPEMARGILTTIVIEPAGAAAALLERSRRLEAALMESGTRMVARVEFELVGTEATDVSVVTEDYKNRWRARGGWVDTRGWPVVFWSDFPLARAEGFAEHRGQPWGEAWLVDMAGLYREDVTLLIYLELQPR
jgi:hypothetical protein